VLQPNSPLYDPFYFSLLLFSLFFLYSPTYLFFNLLTGGITKEVGSLPTGRKRTNWEGEDRKRKRSSDRCGSFVCKRRTSRETEAWWWHSLWRRYVKLSSSLFDDVVSLLLYLYIKEKVFKFRVLRRKQLPLVVRIPRLPNPITYLTHWTTREVRCVRLAGVATGKQEIIVETVDKDNCIDLPLKARLLPKCLLNAFHDSGQNKGNQLMAVRPRLYLVLLFFACWCYASLITCQITTTTKTVCVLFSAYEKSSHTLFLLINGHDLFRWRRFSVFPWIGPLRLPNSSLLHFEMGVWSPLQQITQTTEYSKGWACICHGGWQQQSSWAVLLRVILLWVQSRSRFLRCRCHLAHLLYSHRSC